MNWRCRSTKIFAIFLNLESYDISSETLVEMFFILCPYIAQMQYMYDFLQTLCNTAILGGEETIMKNKYEM